ncbi:MAG: hypothetical protein IT275_00210 [Chitinophagales bacterium]|nr:hypothetical protein [Chitinophagales bacterium]
MQLKENSNASAYYNLLSNLNESSKLELIAHLSNSILKNKSSKPKSFERLFGAWKSKETAEEIIDNIRKSRVSNRKIESF